MTLNNEDKEKTEYIFKKDIEDDFEKEEENIKLLNTPKFSNKDIIIKSLFNSLKNWKHKAIEQLRLFVIKSYSFYLPIAKANLLDTVISPKDYNQILLALKKYLSVLLFQYIIESAFDFLEKIFEQKLKVNYKLLLLKKIVQKDLYFFEIFKTGELLDKINNYSMFDDDYVSKILSSIQDTIRIFLMVYYMLYTSFKLSLVFLITFFIDKGANFIFNKYTFDENMINALNSLNPSKYSNKLHELISNIRMIKSFAKEDDEVKEIEKLQNIDISFNFGFIFKFSLIWSDILESISLFCVGNLILNQHITLGLYTIFKQYKAEFNGSLYSVKSTINSMKTYIKDYREFLEISDFPIKIKSLKEYKPKEIKGKIKFDNVTFAYPLKPNSNVLNKLSFEIPSGKTFAICGTSGGGKSTIFNLLERFYDPIDGNIFIDDINIKDYQIKFLRESIGYVAQEPILNSGTILENILYGVDKYTKKQLDEVIELSNIDSFINDKYLFPEGLKTLVGEKGIKVSGGQKQRIAIARALMKNSKILIFDEATSALDAESESEVQKAIDNVVKKRGVTIIIIAHRLSTIINADLIGVLNKGKIDEIGSHKELMSKKGEYTKLFQKQMVEYKDMN